MVVLKRWEGAWKERERAEEEKKTKYEKKEMEKSSSTTSKEFLFHLPSLFFSSFFSPTGKNGVSPITANISVERERERQTENENEQIESRHSF